MGRVTQPGKFEGEMEYAEAFHAAMLNGMVDEYVQTPGGEVLVFYLSKGDEMIKEYPDLEGYDAVAFIETDQGFWTEVEVPSQEEIDNPFPSDDELGDALVIEDARGGAGYDVRLEGKLIADSVSWETALSVAQAEMKSEGYYPSMYFVNERGNIDALDHEGKILQSWV